MWLIVKPGESKCIRLTYLGFCLQKRNKEEAQQVKIIKSDTRYCIDSLATTIRKCKKKSPFYPAPFFNSMT